MYAYSQFECYTKTISTMHEVADWSEFVLAMAALTEPRDATDRVKKYGTPAISPAVYPPGAQRGNDKVLSWGGWVALDVDNDLLNVPADESVQILRNSGMNFLVYGSTKCRADVNRYRIIMPLNRHLESAEAQLVWKAVTQAFSFLGPDSSCKDISRIYGAPSHWLAHPDGNKNPFNIFEFNIDGEAIDVDAVLATYEPPAAPEMAPYVAPEPSAQPAPWVTTTTTRLKQLPSGHSLFNSPVVASEYASDYFALGKGEHHPGMFRFMTRVIGRAKAKGFEVTEADIFQYCRELDTHSPIKTSSERWSRMPYEISRAFAFSSR